MKKNFLLVCLALLSLLGAKAQVPTTSTDESIVWYFIKAQRSSTPNALWVTASEGSSVIRQQDLSLSDAQRWKVVVNGDGLALVNKQFGTYLNSDSLDYVELETCSSTPKTTLQFTLSKHLENAVHVENKGAVSDQEYSDTQTTNTFLMHAGSSGVLINYWDDYADNSSFMFIQDTPQFAKQALKLAIDNATTVYNSTAEGTNPGQFTSDTRTGFESAIIYAQDTYDNQASTTTEIETTISSLFQTVNLYKTLVILPEASTINEEKWYFIQGERPENTYLTSQGADAELIAASVKGDDNQLWKIVKINNGCAFVNKATGQYINTDIESDNVLSTQAIAPKNVLNIIMSPKTTNSTSRFWVENADGSTPNFRLHAGWSKVLNWTGNALDNCTWLFVAYGELEKVEYLDAVKKARSTYNSTSSNTGEGFGQYSQAKQSAFNSVISAAEAKDISSMTKEDFISGIADIASATTNYTINSDAKLLVNANLEKDSWYWIRSTATDANRTYVVGKVLTTNGVVTDSGITYEAKAETPTDEQLWRFEVTGTELKIINKAANKFQISADGKAVTEGGLFTLTPITADKISFWIVPSGQDANQALHGNKSPAELVNWCDKSNNSSAWVFDYAMETSKSTGINDVNTINYHIRSNNGIITVDGVKFFDVYSIIGQKQNVKSVLKSGVYFVIVNNIPHKVIVK